jgi:anti-sigma factor RsiW
MEKSVYQKLKELSWQRKLTPQEELELGAYLATHSEAEADWNQESALTDFLDKLPNAPVSSNFTSRVLQAVELEEKKISRAQGRGWAAWRTGLRWVFRSAIAGSLASVALLVSYQYRLSQQGESIRNVSVATTTAKLQWLQDFDAINRMSRVQSPADEELLAALR